METALSILEFRDHNAHMDTMKLFGQLIDRAMRAKGIAAYELAAQMGRQPSFISRIVNGQNANPPDPQTFKELAKILGLSPDHMLQALGYLDRDELNTQSSAITEEILLHLGQIEDWQPWQTEYMVNAIQNMISLGNAIGDQIRSEQIRTDQTVITTFVGPEDDKK